MVTTFDDDTLRSRPMHIVQESFDGVLYFFAPNDGSIVSEAVDYREVGIAFSDRQSGTYLSLSGNAQLSNNKEKFDELWNDDMDLLFPKGKDGGEAALLAVEIYQGESWSAHKGLSRFHERLRAHTDKKPAHMSTNDKYNA